jgi:hypothetical protein
MLQSYSVKIFLILSIQLNEAACFFTRLTKPLSQVVGDGEPHRREVFSK